MDSISLNERYDIERRFHNEWARTLNLNDILVRESFEAVTAPENRAVMRRFGDLKGKRVLDLGCGAGEASVYFALKGADVYAVDLSEEMLKRTSELAKNHGVHVQTFAGPSEQLVFDDGFFDCIYGSSILHHADLHLTIKETGRVLKDTGRAIFIEPLSYNPVINFYRKIAEDVRTPTETSFNFRDFAFLKTYFGKVDYEFFWLTTLNIFLFMYFIERVNPTKDRYWKRIIREHQRYERMYKTLDSIDEKLLKFFPLLKYLCWTTMIVLTEKKIEGF
ncbi:MAG: class I SAM-dependent methyltransferase [Candidatus Omnitrophota bacterium]